MARQRKKIRKGKPKHSQSTPKPSLVEIHKQVKEESPDATPEFINQQTAGLYAAQMHMYMMK